MLLMTVLPPAHARVVQVGSTSGYPPTIAQSPGRRPGFTPLAARAAASPTVSRSPPGWSIGDTCGMTAKATPDQVRDFLAERYRRQEEPGSVLDMPDSEVQGEGGSRSKVAELYWVTEDEMYEAFVEWAGVHDVQLTKAELAAILDTFPDEMIESVKVDDGVRRWRPY